MTEHKGDPSESPSSGRIVGGEHRLAVRVYYEDTDFTGVVYHANYLRFFERGRSDYLRLIVEAAALSSPGAFAAVRMEIDWRAPARIHDALLVCTRLAEFRPPKLIFAQRVERGGMLLCDARVTAVPIREDGKVRRPTPEEMAVWRSFLDDLSHRPA